MTDPVQDHSSLEISEERVSKIWAQVSQRLEPLSADKKTKSRAVFRASLAAALVAVALSFLWVFPGNRSSTGTVLSTRSDTLAMKLDEGSELELASESKLVIDSVHDDDVSLRLDRGMVTCEVPKRKGRTFRVRAGDFEVSVVGTRFSVRHETNSDGALISVRVEHGVVLVKRHGREGPGVRISAGQTWSSEEKLSAPAVAPVQAGPQAQPMGAADPPNRAEEVAREPAGHELSKATPPGGPTASIGRPTAEQAFEDASALRRSGKMRAAAAAYERFVAEFPTDPRAALAAFEKARLQMDGLGQPRAALTSLELSLRLSPRAGFREDVLARLVRVQKVLGQSEACRAAKQRYLREYPKGVHHTSVEQSCAEE